MTIPSEVQPGQLITAAFMNEILAELADIRAQLANLPGSTAPGLAILSLVPSGATADPIKVGSELRIIGQEFRFTAGGHRVSFDGLQVNAFKAGSSDTILVVDVPQPPGTPLPLTGRGVVLRVENGLAAVNRVITVRPAQVQPSGGVNVTWRDDIPNPVPDPIVAGGTASFAYRVQSLANIAAEYLVEVVTVPTTFQSLAVVTDTNGAPIPSRQFTLEPGAVRDIVVQIPLPGSADGQAFNLSVTATVPGAGAGFNPGSDSRGFTVGAAAPPQDPSIDLGSPVFSAIDPATGAVDPAASFSGATNTITLPAGSLGTMQFSAQFQVPGNYNIIAGVPAGTSGWTITPVPASVAVTTVNQTESVRFTLQATGSATTPTVVEYRVINATGIVPQSRIFTAVRT